MDARRVKTQERKICSDYSERSWCRSTREYDERVQTHVPYGLGDREITARCERNLFSCGIEVSNLSQPTFMAPSIPDQADIPAPFAYAISNYVPR